MGNIMPNSTDQQATPAWVDPYASVSLLGDEQLDALAAAALAEQRRREDGADGHLVTLQDGARVQVTPAEARELAARLLLEAGLDIFGEDHGNYVGTYLVGWDQGMRDCHGGEGAPRGRGLRLVR